MAESLTGIQCNLTSAACMHIILRVVVNLDEWFTKHFSISYSKEIGIDSWCYVAFSYRFSIQDSTKYSPSPYLVYGRHVHLPRHWIQYEIKLVSRTIWHEQQSWNIIQVFINASICTHSHAGNDKGMLQQQRELVSSRTVSRLLITTCT